jgi:nifR3 family TIM-barrel protein
MRIGAWQFDFPLYLAPMAGVTDRVFRGLCKEFGADVLVTEFVSAEGIFRRNARTEEYLDFAEAERPLGVQMFGANPEHLAEAARAVIGWKRPDFIDLNFGCPVNKVVCKNGGAALLRDCPLLEKVARAVVEAAGPVPVTAKIRTGWSRAEINAVRTAKILEDAGVRAVAVHGRTKDQGYSGEADWGVIDEVARAVSIPVVGNGDIDSAGAALRRKRETGVSGLMLGRAAMSHPWVFREIKAALAGDPAPSPPGLAERWEFILRFARLEADAWGGDGAVRHLRSRLMALAKGFPAAKELRQRLARAETLADLKSLAEWSVRNCE